MPHCYMCNADATTKEHAPPKSFFPPENRTNLITVPSCIKHNLDNSLDVEYVRNVIVLHFSTNDAARSLALGKVMRAFRRSIALTKATLEGLRPIVVNGELTGGFNVDLDRFKHVMSAVAYAEWFRATGCAHVGNWKVFGASLTSASTQHPPRRDRFEAVRDLADRIQYTLVPTSEPDIFKCSISRDGIGGLIYKFEFYQGFLVYVFSANVPDA